MALLGGKRIHLVIGDIRIAGIGDIIKGNGGANEHIELKKCMGASLGVMVDEAMRHLSKCPFDVIYLAGGACDITRKDRLTGIIYFDWEGDTSLLSHLVMSLNKANTRLTKYFPASRIVFCPLIGSELKIVVHGQVTSKNHQLMVDNAIWRMGCTCQTS